MWDDGLLRSLKAKLIYFSHTDFVAPWTSYLGVRSAAVRHVDEPKSEAWSFVRQRSFPCVWSPKTRYRVVFHSQGYISSRTSKCMGIWAPWYRVYYDYQHHGFRVSINSPIRG